MTEPSSDVISHALQAVQEGLKSMQSLQFQTAETHKLFLQTQTEASKTLQKMMDHTRRIAEASLGISVIAPEDRGPEAAAGGRKPQAMEPETADRRQTTNSGGRPSADKDFFPSSVIHHPPSESHQSLRSQSSPDGSPCPDFSAAEKYSGH